MVGKFWREHDGVKKMTVYFLGGKFSRRYIFFGGDVEPTRSVGLNKGFTYGFGYGPVVPTCGTVFSTVCSSAVPKFHLQLLPQHSVLHPVPKVAPSDICDRHSPTF